MNLELDEEYGAGFEGTKALLYKYLKDTPGQKIIKYMDKNNVLEVKSSANLKVGDAVKVTLSSGTTNWSTGKTTRPEVTAIGKILKIATQQKSVHANDYGQMYTVKFKNPLSGRIETNEFGSVMPESVEFDENFNAAAESLYTKYKFLRRQADEADEAYKKARGSKLDDDSLETYYTTMRNFNDKADDAYDAYKAVRDKANKNESVELGESSSKDFEVAATELDAAYKKDKKDSKAINPKWMHFVNAAIKHFAIKDAKEISRFKYNLGMSIQKQAFKDASKIDSNKLAADAYKAAKDIKNESVDLEEALVRPFAIVDTADGNIVVATSSSEEAAKSIIASSENPHGMAIKDKTKLKIVRVKKKVHLGYPIDEQLEEAVDFRTMKDDSLKQWLSKNDTDDSVSPVFGAQILAAKKEAKRRGISFTEDVEIEEAYINVTKYECGSEKSQFGGYRPHIVNKENGKTMYLGQASYNTPAEAKTHAENYLKQYAQGIQHPKVPIKGTYIKEDQGEISLQTRRMMKTIALITGNTDADALYEYALTSPTYSSLVELKENFNKYIQDA